MYKTPDPKPCPIGTQTYSTVIESGCIYIDKTPYIHRMVTSQNRYWFLSRPRRFGKSLLCSTLKSYFEGEEKLFAGTYIATVTEKWTVHPVLHFSMADGKHMDKDGLERYLSDLLLHYEKRYGIDAPATDVNVRLKNLIVRANEQTGEKVVVIIDEYDAPLLDVVHEDEQLPTLRNVMRNFYSPLKGCDPYLRFVFLTGITKFSQLSIFSELNNIANISMLPEYAGICGITREEMLEQMRPHIARLAERLEVTEEECVRRLTDRYDGYHFTWPSPDIFNPYSLLNCFEFGRLDNYWFGSGTPTYLIEMLRKFHVLPTQLTATKAAAADFDAPTERMESATPLLYQSGYLTIKDYRATAELFTLDVPNREIRVGLMKSLLPAYARGSRMQGNSVVAMMYECLLDEDLEGMLELLRTFLGTVPYCENTHYEGHYQQMLYVIFSIFGMYVDVEVRTVKGRIDIVLPLKERIYVFEIKTGATAERAMRQIFERKYFERFALLPQPVTSVAVNFSLEERNITDWEINAEDAKTNNTALQK